MKEQVKVISKNDEYTGDTGIVIERLVFDSAVLVEFPNGTRKIYYDKDLKYIDT